MGEFIPPATKFAELPKYFTMERGGTLHGAHIAYETFGSPASGRDNAILILTGLSPDAHVASHPNDHRPGWWEAMVGPEKPIDTNRWYVICLNSLGGCNGSTGPASVEPVTGEPYRLTYPELTIEDIADAAAHTVRILGFNKLACVVGASMGGMSALAMLVRHPELARTHINISGAVHSIPFASAIRSVQREAIRFDPQWNGGDYDDRAYPERGMLTARKLGMITYRSAEEWDNRFGRARMQAEGLAPRTQFSLEFEVESYLECHAHRFARRFDPNSYLYLSRAIDWFDLGEVGGASVDEVLSDVSLDKALIMGVKSDLLYPLKQQRQIAEGLREGGTDVEFLELDSPEGHDAFLVDTQRFGPPLAKFLSFL